MSAALVEEAIKKAALAWVGVGDGPALALWCMPLDGSLIVVSGPGEQAAPGLAEATQATVRLRGDTGGLILSFPASVTPVSDEEILAQLAGKRLNASGTAQELVARWAANGCAVVRLTPVPEEATSGVALPDESGAAEPRETSVRVAVRSPFRLHRVRRR